MDARALAIHLEPRSGVPLHRQLEAALGMLIQTGRLRPGEALPGELELTAHLGVSRHTVRQALGALVAEGLLHRRRGVGTTVASPTIERSLDSFYAFAWEVRARGAEHRSKVLERVAMPADEHMAGRLHVPVGGLVERIERLRMADGEPLVLETAYLPADLAAGLDQATLEREALYDALERLCAIRITHARETIRPVVLERAVAQLLSVRAGAPAFLVERMTWADQLPVEWKQSLVRGDRYLYSVELPRRDDAGQR
ncbi:MAG: GntR family transcriptional regulator [Chloroflexi bacterium]|nr:GntR family transcriptional regulator [Chloroflexota bacterium]